MIVYRPLSLETALLATTTPEAATNLVRSAAASLRAAGHGFELVVKALRDAELDALNTMNKTGAPTEAIWVARGVLSAVRSIRATLTPPPMVGADDWKNEATEAFLEDYAA